MNSPMAPPRLRVGIVSAGRVGCALGEALAAAGHRVDSVYAHSPRSLEAAARRLPFAAIANVDQIADASDLILIAVPDPELPGVVQRIAASDRLRPGTIVAHTAGALGVTVLDPLARRGCIVAAVHPAMTFVGTPDDTARLATACFGVTTTDEVGDAIAMALVMEMGATGVRIAETSRALYHAALAHGANNLNALIVDAVTALAAAIGGPVGDGADTATLDGGGRGLAQELLGPLVTASLQNALEHGSSALTGPVARGDTATVARHLDELSQIHRGIACGYRALAARAADQQGADSDLVDLLADCSATTDRPTGDDPKEGGSR